MRWRFAVIAAGALSLLGLTSVGLAADTKAREPSGSPATVLLNPTIAPGGGVIDCGDFSLAYTLGEPVVGTVSASGWALHSGFLPTLPRPDAHLDIIFANGFQAVATFHASAGQECTP